jgi:hypothetical protein
MRGVAETGMGRQSVGSIQFLGRDILLFVRTTATRTTDPEPESNTAAPVLWSPEDKNALPSPEDMKHAKEVIVTLQRRIKDGFALVRRTRLRLAEMKKELAERKGWIAPIRKVPTEVLIDILLRTSEMDDLAPVRFTAVSRLWRSIILATPKAWSFIDLSRNYDRHFNLRTIKEYHDYFPGYRDTYFERSKPRLLHLCLPQEEEFWPKHSTSIITKQAKRIMCLTTSTDILSTSQSSSRCQQFPSLQTLTVVSPSRRNGTSLDASFFSISRLPALQILRLPPDCWLTVTNHTISPSTFPPLQHLTVDIGRFSACMDMLQSCAGTLESLSIGCFYEARTTASPLEVTFPLLRCLTIGGGPSGISPLVKATTPVLSSLVVESTWSVLPVFFDADVQNVTHLRWNKYECKLPSICTQIRVLQTMVDFRSEEYVDYANKLKEIAAAYPSLETIEISSKYGYLQVSQQKVEECLGAEFVRPKLLWTREWQGDFPGYVATKVRSFASNL